MNKLKKYALYKGETLIASGTSTEIAEELGLQPRTINYYGTPAYRSRTKRGNAYRVVNLDADDIESGSANYQEALKLACLDIKNKSAPGGLSVKAYIEYYIQLSESEE